MESRYDRSISHVGQGLMKMVFIYALQMELPPEQDQPKQTENAPSSQQTSAETLVRSTHLKRQILIKNQGSNHVCYSKRSLSWTTHLHHRCPRHQPSGMMRKRQAFPSYIQNIGRLCLHFSVLWLTRKPRLWQGNRSTITRLHHRKPSHNKATRDEKILCSTIDAEMSQATFICVKKKGNSCCQ